MKKLIFIVMASAFIYSCGSSSGDSHTSPGECGSGSGTSRSPYVLCDREDLKNIRNNMSASYMLAADINMGNTLWEPIGTRTNPFRGSLDGQGHTISGLRIDAIDYAGLFGYLNGASLSHINIILGPEGITGNNYIGGVAGRMDRGTIAGCSVEGYIDGKNDVGGIAGRVVSGVIEASRTSGTIYAAGVAGGIAGSLDSNSIIRNSYATVDIQSKNYAGGIAGHTLNSTITMCYATGAVENTDTASTRVGGITGRGENSTISSNLTLNSRLSAQRLVNRIAGEAVGCTDSLNYSIPITLWGAQSGGIEGITITRSEAENPAVYLNMGWRFGNTLSAPWKVVEDLPYPQLLID